MRLAEAVDYPIARRPWTLCLTLLLCATPFVQAQTSTPAEKDEITDQAGFSSSKTTRIADDDATTAVASLPSLPTPKAQGWQSSGQMHRNHRTTHFFRMS